MHLLDNIFGILNLHEMSIRLQKWFRFFFIILNRFDYLLNGFYDYSIRLLQLHSYKGERILSMISKKR